MRLTDYTTIARGWRAVAAIAAVLAAVGLLIAVGSAAAGHIDWVYRGLIALVACGVTSVVATQVARMYIAAADDTDTSTEELTR